MRSVLGPLAQLAERTQAAFLFVHHLNKSGMGRALYRPGGSIAITAAVRSALLLGADPNDPERVVLASSKNNLGPEPYSLAFRKVTSQNGKPIPQWLGRVPYTADMLLANSDGSANRGEKIEEATDLLMTSLANGPVPAAEVEAQARAQGVSERTVRRAKALLGVRATKRPGEEHGPWLWILPQDDQPPTEEGSPPPAPPPAA